MSSLQDRARELIGSDPVLAGEIARQFAYKAKTLRETFSLTQRQRQALNYIRTFTEVNGFAPSFDEIQSHLDLASKSGVHRIVCALEERGYIRRLYRCARSIQLVS